MMWFGATIVISKANFGGYMPRNIMLRKMLTLCAMSLAALTSQAQDYPVKPIRMIAPEAGSGSDILARMIAGAMAASFKQQVVVENRGGNIIVPIEMLIGSAPDGYNLLFFSNAVWMAPLLQSVRFDPLKDITPITLAVSSPAVLAVHPSMPIKSVSELIALAKRRPGEINFAGGGFGSANHLAGELFKSMAGINLAYVPYKGSGGAITATLSGEVSALFTTVSSVLPFLKTGRLKVLGVTSAQPTDLAPGVPAISATVPGYEAAVKFAILAPARTPAAIVERLNSEIVRYVKNPQSRELLLKAGADAVGTTSQELSNMMKSDMTIMSKVIKEAGIKVN